MAPHSGYSHLPQGTRSDTESMGRVPAPWRPAMREESGVMLRGPHGQRGDPRRGWYGKFAGILQVEIRQRVSRVRMLRIVLCEGYMR
jgi:hypothetical protein